MFQGGFLPPRSRHDCSSSLHDCSTTSCASLYPPVVEKGKQLVLPSPRRVPPAIQKRKHFIFSQGARSRRDFRVLEYPCTRIVPRYYEQTVERTGASVPLVLLAIVFSQCSGGPLFLGLDFIVRLGTLQWSCRLLAVIIRHGRSWFLSANFVFSKTLARAFGVLATDRHKAES